MTEGCGSSSWDKEANRRPLSPVLRSPIFNAFDTLANPGRPYNPVSTIVW